MKRKIVFGIKKKLIIGVISIIVPIFTTIALLLFIQGKATIINELNNTMSAESLSISKSINMDFVIANTEVQNIQQNEFITSFVKDCKNTDSIKLTNEYEYLVKTLKAIKASHNDFYNVYIGIDKLGLLISDTEWVSPPDYVMNNRTWYKMTLQNNRLTFTDPYIDAITGKLVITISTPINNGNNIIGVAAIDVALNQIAEIMKKYKIKNTGFAFLVNSTGRILYHPDNETFLKKNITEYQGKTGIIGSKMMEGETGVDIIYFKGSKHYIAYAPIESNRWSVGVVVPAVDVQQEYIKFTKIFVVAALAALIILLFMIYILSNKILRHIPLLLKCFKSAMDGDLTVRAEINSSDEIEQLAIGFNNMIDSLQQADINLKRSNEELSILYEDLSASEEELRHQFNELQEQKHSLEKSKERYKLSVQGSNDVLWDWDLSNNKFFISDKINDIMVFNFKENSNPYVIFASSIHHDDFRKVSKVFKQHLIGRSLYLNCEFRVMSPENEWKWILVKGKALRNIKGKPVRLAGSITDISNYKNTLKLLQQSEEKYRILVENTKDMIFSYDCNNNITAVNRAFCKSMNVSQESVIGRNFFEINLNKEFINEISNLSSKVKSENYTITKQCVLQENNSNVRILETTVCPVNDDNCNISGVVVTINDITEIKNYESHVQHLAFYDSLTDLPNRVLFINKLNMAITESKDHNIKGAVIFVDLDNFKNINDTLGHSFGDELLKEISNKLKNVIEGDNTVARLGGDEFTILLKHINNPEYAAQIAEKLNDLFKDPFIIKDNKVFITASIGITMFPNDGTNFEDLLKNADTAMYKAKDLGKNNYQFYNKAMNEAISYKTGIANDLRDAITNNEFVLHYQPQIDLKTKKIRSFEALIRWQKPDGKVISPSDFIPIAEETGLILNIGEWVLRTACKFGKELLNIGYQFSSISINLSVLQLKQKNLVEIIQGILMETGLDPKFIELEITESMLIDSFDSTVILLNQLRKMGITISLDDFGTGYSSLNYLKQLPIDFVKIDKSFVKDLMKDSIEKSITGSIIRLAHNIGLRVVAEGVENKKQLQYLIDKECDTVQGYLFSKPLTGFDIISKYENNICIFNVL